MSDRCGAGESLSSLVYSWLAVGGLDWWDSDLCRCLLTSTPTMTTRPPGSDLPAPSGRLFGIITLMQSLSQPPGLSRNSSTPEKWTTYLWYRWYNPMFCVIRGDVGWGWRRPAGVSWEDFFFSTNRSGTDKLPGGNVWVPETLLGQGPGWIPGQTVTFGTCP